MTTRTLLQLLPGPNGVLGEQGFTLTGVAKEGHGLCRVSLRRVDAWHRYLDPRMLSEDWDVRVYTKMDSAFALMPDYTVVDLESLEEFYEFPDGGERLAELALNGDPVHDRAVVWARRVTGAPELPAPAPVDPANIDLRYTKQTVASAKPTLMPLGRSTPPMQPIRPFSANLLAPQNVSGGASGAPEAAAKPARPAPSARPAAGPPAAGPPSRPAPPTPAGRSDLADRLRSIREKSGEGEEG